MESLQSRLEDVLAEFELAGEWNDRYRLLVQWGDEAPPLPESECVEPNEVFGCSSPLWLRVWIEADRLRVQGRSTGVLAKALAALVQHLFDGVEVSQAQGQTSRVVDALDLKKHLSPTRLLVFERMLDRVFSIGQAP